MPVSPTGGRPVFTSAGARRLPPRIVAPLVVSAFLAIAIAAVGASGAERSPTRPIPDSAFGPVVVLPGASAPNGLGPIRTPDLSAIRDPLLASAPPARVQPALPGANPVVVAVTTHRISGTASWYCRAGSSPCSSGYADGGGYDAYAAAGPRLRAAIGSGWRGKVVLVDGLRVKLIDWCQCYEGQSNEKLLDLYYDVFARTGSSVTIRW